MAENAGEVRPSEKSKLFLPPARFAGRKFISWTIAVGVVLSLSAAGTGHWIGDAASRAASLLVLGWVTQSYLRAESWVDAVDAEHKLRKNREPVGFHN